MKEYPCDTASMVFNVIKEYSVYWRDLEDNHFSNLEDWECDEIYFFFNENLLGIARAHFDMYWIIQDHDDQQLYRDGRQPKPFWHSNRKKNSKKKRG